MPTHAAPLPALTDPASPQEGSWRCSPHGEERGEGWGVIQGLLVFAEPFVSFFILTRLFAK